MVYGVCVFLVVGFGVGIMVCFLVIVIGVFVGYFGGKIDDFFIVVMNIMLVIL